MKIVVIGGSGFIGSKLVKELRHLNHNVVSASSGTVVSANCAEKLGEVLRGTQVVIDVTNAPASEDNAMLDDFKTSGRNLLAEEAVAGVKHHVILSLVGIERMEGSNFFEAKKVQENLVKASEVPYTILQSTQFYEMVRGIAQAATIGQEIHISNAKVQPVASDDVAEALADITLSRPLNITVQIAGPERLQLDELIRIFLNETNDPRKVIIDKHAIYFGVELKDLSLIAEDNARIGKIRFIDWLRDQDK